MKGRLKIIIKAIPSKDGFFSVNQIAKETLIGAKGVQIVLDRLFREGLIQRFDLVPNPGENSPLRGRPKKRTIYQVTDKKRFEERFSPRLKQNTGADRMWKMIRYKRSFTIRDLVVLAEVKRENARWFVKQLYRARYIVPSRSGGPGVEWSLIKLRDPGPKRPYLSDAAITKKGKESGPTSRPN
jgi:DNA-binding Lrp family transcriptional regulator